MRNGRISWLRAFAARVLGLFGPRKRDNDFDEEVQAHLQLLTDGFVAQGMSQQDAAAAARRQFGNTTLLQEDRRELRTLISVEDLRRNLHYALRSLGRVVYPQRSPSLRWDWDRRLHRDRQRDRQRAPRTVPL
jgi:hypothetical protein